MNSLSWYSARAIFSEMSRSISAGSVPKCKPVTRFWRDSDEDRTSYRYQPKPERNAELCAELIALARQKPRYGYRRLHLLLSRRGFRGLECARCPS
jgi:hypothetical protein